MEVVTVNCCNAAGHAVSLSTSHSHSPPASLPAAVTGIGMWIGSRHDQQPAYCFLLDVVCLIANCCNAAGHAVSLSTSQPHSPPASRPAAFCLDVVCLIASCCNAGGHAVSLSTSQPHSPPASPPAAFCLDVVCLIANRCNAAGLAESLSTSHSHSEPACLPACQPACCILSGSYANLSGCMPLRLQRLHVKTWLMGVINNSNAVQVVRLWGGI